jgi:transcriptional regulator with XRE-family HTH domain
MISNSAYGLFLREWREKRRFSQLSLGHIANVSARHVSFLETGRAKPSREMVLQLGDCLSMPMAQINHALHLAGYSPAYKERTIDDADLVPIHRAIAHLLENHMPFPAIGLDRLWNIKAGNLAAMALLNDAGFAGHTNMLEALCDQTPQQSSIENWEEAIGLLLTRLHSEMLAGGSDPKIQKLVQKLTTHFERHAKGTGFDRTQAVMPTRFRIGPKIISVFSTIASFGSVQDVILDDYKIELMFPMDEASRDYFIKSAKIMIAKTRGSEKPKA